MDLNADRLGSDAQWPAFFTQSNRLKSVLVGGVA